MGSMYLEAEGTNRDLEGKNDYKVLQIEIKK